MESCEATNKPDSYEAVNYENAWEDIMWHGFHNTSMFLNDFDPRKNENIYARMVDVDMNMKKKR